jgi:hypothetical protein
LPALQNELNSGDTAVFEPSRRLLQPTGQSVRSVAVELLAQTGQVSDPQGLPPIRWFLNLNTPDDLGAGRSASLRPGGASRNLFLNGMSDASSQPDPWSR